MFIYRSLLLLISLQIFINEFHPLFNRIILCWVYPYSICIEYRCSWYSINSNSVFPELSHCFPWLPWWSILIERFIKFSFIEILLFNICNIILLTLLRNLLQIGYRINSVYGGGSKEYIDVFKIAKNASLMPYLAGKKKIFKYSARPGHC